MSTFYSPQPLVNRVCVCSTSFRRNAIQFRLKAVLQTVIRQTVTSNLEMLLQKVTRSLPAGITFLIVVLSLWGTLHGQELDPVLAHVDGQTSALVRIDAAALDALVSTTNPRDNDAEQTVLQDRLKQTRKLLAGDPIWLAIGFPQTPLSIQILIRDPDGSRIESLKNLWDFPERYPYGPEPAVVIRELSDFDSPSSSDTPRLEQWKRLMAPKTGNRKATIQFASLPPAHLYETYLELLTDLPDSLGGGPITLLTDGLQSVSGSFELKTGALASTIKSASPEAAAAFAERANQWLTLLTRGSMPSEKTKAIEPLIQQLGRSIFNPAQATVRWEIPTVDTWQPEKVLELAIGSAANRSAIKRLRLLALGALNYESARQHLAPPPDSRGPDGPTGLSWRVHILPYLGKAAFALYKKFKLDEPWDSPTNIQLLPEMPSVFSEYGSQLLAPVSAKPGYTTVVAPISDNTILGAPRKVTFSAIVDGSSNTILMVIVKDALAVPWTAPQDYVFDPDRPAAGLKFVDGIAPVAFCDSSTSQLIEENDWVNLFEMNDGELVHRKEKTP